MPTTLVAAFLLPPLAPLLGILVGCLLLRRKPKTGWSLIALSWGALALLATPLVGSALLSLLEPPFADPLRSPADAIVVLGGGSYSDAPEYGADTVDRATLERLRYAAQLYRRSGKPILVTGGNPLGNTTSEAMQMRVVLEREWHIPVAWTEQTSVDTLENAFNSYAILEAAGIHRIYLVTHAWHMARARLAFERAGFSVVPAATHYTTHYRSILLALLPGVEGLHRSALFCHEVLGLLWYRLKLPRD